jgi:phosphoribosylformylglycinamidine synthase
MSLLESSATHTRTFCIEVARRNHEGDGVGLGFVEAAHQSGLTSLTDCRVAHLYFLHGRVAAADIAQLARRLLSDPVTETFTLSGLEVGDCPAALPSPSAISSHGTLKDAEPVQSQSFSPTAASPLWRADHFIDVSFLPGVTDPAAENLVRAAHLLGLKGLERAATGRRYRLTGTLSTGDLRRLAVDVFSNPVIQRHTIDHPIDPPFFPFQQTDGTVEVMELRSADDAGLLEISAARRLALDLAEMQAIRSYFRQEGRDPTDAELETLAQTWSEHCAHKTFKAVIHYTGPAAGAAPDGEPVSQTIGGLLRTYIRGATEEVGKPWIRSSFVDNAGVIAFDEAWDLAFKVETHNHPSALEPFGGANTGVGGVVRDVLGVSARPIANTDVLCFGPPDLLHAQLPPGVLHPRRIAAGVERGIEDYGNKMGIPTVNGAILYHAGYTANPLVFCGCLGLLPRGSHPSAPESGDLIVVVGGRTGRDGLRGATFSSMEMDQKTGEIAGSAVQIGHPIHEKQVLEVLLRARDERLYHAVTDCGAGGLSSAVGEMGRRLGARVRLEAVPLKYPGLRPWEIWLSEAQERMVLAVPPEHWPRLEQICAGQEVEAVCIGEFEATGRLRLFYGDRLVGDLAITFLHEGVPQRRLEAVWKPTSSRATSYASAGLDLTRSLLALLAHPNIRSKESVIRRYDHEVQGGTAIKPLVGVGNHGPGDATVLVPFDTLTGDHPGEDGLSAGRRGVALGVGICPAYGELDPYAMSWAAVDEAMRNVVAVGADPDRVALLDNFCWGNPNLPDRLGSLVRCAQGCFDAAVAYGAPFISGKDSLNNEYTGPDGDRHAIPGTLLISALGIVPDVNRTATMDLKRPGNLLYVIGATRAELGASHYAQLRGDVGGTPPQPAPAALERLRAVHRAIRAGLVRACHDCSEGGLAVALAEMCLAGRLGAEVELAAVPGANSVERDDLILFSESLCRFVVEVHPGDADTFEALLAPRTCGQVARSGYGAGVHPLGLADRPCARVGYVLAQGELRVRGLEGQTIIQVSVSDLETAWRGSSPGLDDEEPLRATKEPGETGVELRPRSSPILRRLSRVGLPRALVLHAVGTNRDREAALACELAGADPDVVHVNQLLSRERRLLDYHILIIPGGFSYGDDLGAGTLWALDLYHRLGEKLAPFVASGRPVLGICNGFQALVKAGLLPGWDGSERAVTLAPNASARFECRWVYLRPNPNTSCLFTAGLDELIYCPVAHAEGRLATSDAATLAALRTEGLVALTYVDANGEPAGYPGNPNGSAWGIAGLCNPAGNVLGLMPHPEDHVFPWQHPRWHRGEAGMLGLRLFENGVRH